MATGLPVPPMVLVVLVEAAEMGVDWGLEAVGYAVVAVGWEVAVAVALAAVAASEEVLHMGLEGMVPVA